MKKRLIIIASLIFVFACIFAVTVSAQCAECDNRVVYQTGSNGFLGEVTVVNSCETCGNVVSIEKVDPLFITKGYSYSDDGSITQRYAVNRVAVARFEELTGETVTFGAVSATRNNVASSPINPDGTPLNEKVVAVDFTNTKYDLFDVIVKGIPEEYQAITGIISGAYVIVDGEVSYIDNGVFKANDSAFTYEEVKVIVDDGIVEKPVAKKQNWDDDGSLKILAIGNSYSEDTMEYAYNVAKSLGIENVEFALIRANYCSLAMHLSNAQNDNGAYMFRYWGDNADRWTDYGSWSNGGTYKMSTAVLQSDWDYIMFQQVSSDSNNAATYDDLTELMPIVEELNSTARFAWNMTWGNKTTSDLSMYNGIVNAVQTKIVPNDKIEVIVPAGTAIQNARTSSLVKLDDLMRNNHLGYGLGRYAAALTFVKAFTGLSIDEIEYVPTFDTEGHTISISAIQKGVVIDAVNNAFKTPYEVTTSTLTAEDATALGSFLIDNDLLNLTKSSYYNKNAGEFYFEPLSGEKVSGVSGVYDYGRYFSTKMFTKETLPVGSVIEVSGGYKYFVEGWELDENGTPIAGEGAFNSRFSATGASSNSDASGFVTTYRVIVTEEWWGDNDIVAFNIGNTATILSGVYEDDIANVFKIYVSYSAEEKNEDGAEDADGNLYDPTPYDKPAYSLRHSMIDSDGKVKKEAINFEASMEIDGKTYYALTLEEMAFQGGFYNCYDNIDRSYSRISSFTSTRKFGDDELLNGMYIWASKNYKADSWLVDGEFYNKGTTSSTNNSNYYRSEEYNVNNGKLTEITDEWWTQKIVGGSWSEWFTDPATQGEGPFTVRGFHLTSHDGSTTAKAESAYQYFKIYVPADMIAAE